MATFFCPQGGRFREVQLYIDVLVWFLSHFFIIKESELTVSIILVWHLVWQSQQNYSPLYFKEKTEKDRLQKIPLGILMWDFSFRKTTDRQIHIFL